MAKFKKETLQSVTNRGATTDKTIILGNDIYAEADTDWSGSYNQTGWASFTAEEIYYRRIGKLVHVWFRLTGTSNAATISFTLPHALKNITNLRHVSRLGYTYDNGTEDDHSGSINIEPNSTTCTLSRAAGAAWTATGVKSVVGQITYVTN